MNEDQDRIEDLVARTPVEDIQGKEEDVDTCINFSMAENGDLECQMFINPGDDKIKVAHFLNNITGGGVDTLLMNLMMKQADDMDVLDFIEDVIDEWGNLKVQKAVTKYKNSDVPIVKPSDFFRQIGVK